MSSLLPTWTMILFKWTIILTLGIGFVVFIIAQLRKTFETYKKPKPPKGRSGLYE